MALTEKDREEIRQTIAQALSMSIVGRVETIITDALSAKVANMQRAQAEAEAKAEEARKEEGSFRERIVSAEKQLGELRAAIRVDMATHAETMKGLGAKKKALEAKVADVENAVTSAGIEAEEKIKASRKHTEEIMLEHQTAIDSIKREHEALEKGHQEFRRSVGL